MSSVAFNVNRLFKLLFSMVDICLWLNILQTESAQLLQLFCRKRVGEAILQLYFTHPKETFAAFFFFCNLRLKIYPCKTLYYC